ncbi:uncharacterized protein TNCT_50311 [Trichonephila clavata]|uniref:Uncharacterized protein n=1 Tax=Trichonephila clavata TaxID=2740835 RepID=A0A8X6FHD8_TRICU|nr:uncharacterized protein TNCT_50311 [Trichonephila clavata]
MKALADDTVGEPLLKSLWLRRLPNNTQTILTALKEDLAGLASVADKVNDLANHLNIHSVTPQTSDNRVAQLEKQPPPIDDISWRAYNNNAPITHSKHK